MRLISLYLLVFSLTTQASILGCDPEYLRKAYSEAHQLAAIEGAPYALMANNAYSAAHSTNFALPAGWQIVAQYTQRGPTGLQYRVFAKRAELDAGSSLDTGNASQFAEIVLALRGTDELADWWHGNISGEQYQQALALIDELRAKFPRSKLTVTGHSLGGGIALYLSMMRVQVSAYVFNPSPVTHTPATPIRNRRVVFWEYDDPLHFGRRWLMHVPKTVFWKFDFVKRDGHKSEVLAKGLLMLAALNNPNYAEVLAQNCAINPLR